MEQSFITDFLKDLAVGFRTAKSYPPGHPVMDKVINNTMEQLERIYSETSEFSMFFLEQTVIFQDTKIDVQKNPAILAMLEALRKIEIDSLSFEANVSPDDLKNLYEVFTTPKMKLKKYGDAGEMLNTKGVQRIKINAVKFGVQTDGTVPVAGGAKKVKTKEEILGALKNLKTFVEKGLPISDTKAKFAEVVEDIENMPEESRRAYSKAIAGIINLVPADSRMQVLQDIDMKPFMLQLLSGAKSDFLIRLIVHWTEHNRQTNVNKMLRSVDEEKFARMVPELKEKMPNIYEHLAQAGVKLLLSDKLSSVVTEEDLRMSINPYFAMLDSQNVSLREEAIKSLLALANRFVSQENYEVTKRIISRLSVALDQEPVSEIIERLIDDIRSLYQICKNHHQKDFCTKLLQPFNTILSREGLSVEFKKNIIEFMGETGHPLGLSILFSFMWESGIYPEVRAAVVKFGAAAVNQALITLREVEDYNIRMRFIDVMKNIGDKSITILLKHLSAPEWYLRRNILTILSDIGTLDIVGHLESLLKDEDYRVRLELVKTFTKLEYKDGLLKAIHDPSLEVKAEALRGLKKKLSAEEFVKLLPVFKNTDDEVYIEVLKVIDDKTIFESVGWIKELFASLASRNDSMARDIKELGIATLVKLQVQNLKSILEDLSHSKDKTLAKLASKALERIA